MEASKNIKNKRALKNIAKDWCMGILLACETDANDGILTEDEMNFVVDEVYNIAFKISKEEPLYKFNDIVKRHLKID